MSSLIIDIGLVVVVLLSFLIGAFRGFLRSFLSVVSWVVAAWVTWKFGAWAVLLLEGWNVTPIVQVIVARLGVFFVVLFVMSVIGHLVAASVSSDGIASVDRTLGAAFGIVRGLVIVVLLAVAFAYLLGTDQPLWEDSILLPAIEPFAKIVQQLISDVSEV
ncbi:MAG: CvpA family protein [Acidiferrobacterales bacterium]|nr:CvpA family protein [Acidiferrobacterales bacterium]